MTNVVPIKKATTETLYFTVTSDGVAVNLTGSTVYFAVKPSSAQPDAQALIYKSWSSHTDAANGATTLILTSSETNIPAGDYSWDLKIKDGSNNISGSSLGVFRVVSDIYRNA